MECLGSLVSWLPQKRMFGISIIHAQLYIVEVILVVLIFVLQLEAVRSERPYGGDAAISGNQH